MGSDPQANGRRTESRFGWLPPQVRALADREREVATIVYRRGASTAIEVENRLSPRITNAAVRSMLVRLIKKGILVRERGTRGRGQQCIYLPAITLADVKERAIRELAGRYFEGSLLTLALEALDFMASPNDSDRELIALLAARTKGLRPPVDLAA
jgi:BlaI family transcriptional regulator, penicillinase repressor